MKKTLTVNLGGTVFHIDEDAYQLLDKYLSNLRVHFQQEEGSDEIMDDFEARISELLNERVRLGYEVITIREVEEVIRRMGKPEEIFADENPEDTRSQRETHQENTTARKRLMRDPDNRILGGVASGFAAYMNWDPTFVRIGLFLLMFFYGITIPLYFLFWIIIPQAKTATDKLEMRGESITVENIGRTVTDGFERVTHNINNVMNSDKPRTALQKAADLFVTIIGLLLKVAGVRAGILLLPVLAIVVLVLIAVLIGLVAGSSSLLYYLSPFGTDFYNGMPTSMIILGIVGAILIIGIPVFALAYAICGYLFKWQPLSTPIKWTLIILWLISIFLCAIYADTSGMLWNWENYWDQSPVAWRSHYFWSL